MLTPRLKNTRGEQAWGGTGGIFCVIQNGGPTIFSLQSPYSRGYHQLTGCWPSWPTLDKRSLRRKASLGPSGFSSAAGASAPLQRSCGGRAVPSPKSTGWGRSCRGQREGYGFMKILNLSGLLNLRDLGNLKQPEPTEVLSIEADQKLLMKTHTCLALGPWLLVARAWTGPSCPRNMWDPLTGRNVLGPWFDRAPSESMIRIASAIPRRAAFQAMASFSR
jgi:hypothetical protein